MPGDPLETLQEGYDAFNRDDTSWTALHATEDVEWGTRGLFPGMEDVYHGRQGVTEWMRVVRAEWEDFRVSLVEVIGQREDALAVVERIWGRGRESGAEGEMTFTTVYHFTPETKIALRTVYESRQAALDAL
jgi:ketosteroid isomerase-like protein